jgi:hypothetical protein
MMNLIMIQINEFFGSSIVTAVANSASKTSNWASLNSAIETGIALLIAAGVIVAGLGIYHHLLKITSLKIVKAGTK